MRGNLLYDEEPWETSKQMIPMYKLSTVSSSLLFIMAAILKGHANQCILIHFVQLRMRKGGICSLTVWFCYGQKLLASSAYRMIFCCYNV